jgi:hypothetical protein
MREMWILSAFVPGLVAGVVTLVVLAIRAALEGRGGVSFADLWTAVAVGVAIGILPLITGKITERRMRRMADTFATRTWTTSGRGGVWHGGLDPPGRMDRFDRFDDDARRVLTLAQDEAQRFNHTHIGTEHLLLALIRQPESATARVLVDLGLDLAKVRTAVGFIVGRGDRAAHGEVGLTAGGKRAIELAIDEARLRDDRYIGTQHLLVGIVREGQDMGAGVLESMGVGLDQVRAAVDRGLRA